MNTGIKAKLMGLLSMILSAASVPMGVKEKARRNAERKRAAVRAVEKAEAKRARRRRRNLGNVGLEVSDAR